jgi:hypothetical protein
MDIVPIQNLIPTRTAAPSAAPADVPTTRAIDFRRQQKQDSDTYTPNGHEEEKRQGEEGRNDSETLEAAPNAEPDPALDEPISQSTISVFA